MLLTRVVRWTTAPIVDEQECKLHRSFIGYHPSAIMVQSWCNRGAIMVQSPNTLSHKVSFAVVTLCNVVYCTGEVAEASGKKRESYEDYCFLP